jgi:hypothetical protein
MESISARFPGCRDSRPHACHTHVLQYPRVFPQLHISRMAYTFTAVHEPYRRRIRDTVPGVLSWVILDMPRRRWVNSVHLPGQTPNEDVKSAISRWLTTRRPSHSALVIRLPQFVNDLHTEAICLLWIRRFISSFRSLGCGLGQFAEEPMRKGM